MKGILSLKLTQTSKFIFDKYALKTDSFYSVEETSESGTKIQIKVFDSANERYTVIEVCFEWINVMHLL